MRLKTNSITNNQQGQVLTFFALSFSFFLVLLMAVINTGILTRDRIKLQNTADLASLVAANVQRFNLNTIGDINDEIDVQFAVAAAALATPFVASPCTQPWATCATAGQCATGTICGQLETVVEQAYLAAYNAFQGTSAAQIAAIVAEANNIAFEQAKRTAVAPPNLPIDLRRALRNHNGGHLPSAKKVFDEYENGGLQMDYGADGEVESLDEIYTVSGNEGSPLFNVEIEQAFIPAFDAQFNPCGILIDSANPCWSGIWLPALPLPVYIVGKRVEDAGGTTPAMITAIAYSPQFNFNFFKQPLRQFPNQDAPFAPGGVAQAPGGAGDINLFDLLLGRQQFAASTNNRQFMAAWATARPFGGSPDSGGYDGAKLIGVSSKQTGEIEQQWGIELTMGNGDGGEHTFTERDFLH